MSLLLHADTIAERRLVARGALAPLAAGLLHELAPVLAGEVVVSGEKALLSRAGGRCPHDGVLLSFDPLDPRHRCPRCGAEASGTLHDRYRLYAYHLWLAERAVHASTLGVLLDDARCVDAAVRLLDAHATQYLQYPNSDNVLGPSRPFFSTYLESIWLLQLMLALDLLETGAPSPEVSALGKRVRERLLEPSAALIASYDEGMSNRQVWNNAALIAAGTLLGDDRMVDRAVDGASGVRAQLDQALLSDGSWYEGENYHLFAHRGLWYSVAMLDARGRSLPVALVDRFNAGFIAPFRTLLPDLTYPSRRDSQYAVSVRQPRFAESCELGLARTNDPRLLGMLARMYDPTVPRTQTGRAASTADVERNLAATGLTRDDLSWRSLMFARPVLPALEAGALESDLLPAQGIGILRRDGGALFVALDYGHSGGGHGHPDRLNLLLSHGATRWFDDPGTGSYVDESLHWYRSTLAHTAPLIDGQSQPRVHGELRAFDERGGAGWISACAELAPGCVVCRSIVVLDGYLVDRLEWTADRDREIALPLHGVRACTTDGRPLAAIPASIEGGSGEEDGFNFLTDGARLHTLGECVQLTGVGAGASTSEQLSGWVFAPREITWWSATAPGAPGRGAQSMVLARSFGSSGAITSVWSWGNTVASADVADGIALIHCSDRGIHRHERVAEGWQITMQNAERSRVLTLGGGVDAPVAAANARSATTATTADVRPSEAPAPRSTERPRPLPARIELGEQHYRRSEQSWDEAGRPSASVSLYRDATDLVVTIGMVRSERRFVPVATENPFDNEPAAINGDSVLLFALIGERSAGWLLVPRDDSSTVDVRAAGDWRQDFAITATWHPTSTGYTVIARVPIADAGRDLELDVLVNETTSSRTRRRGQLVLSGAAGEFVYLRGDRHDRARLIRFALSND